MNVVGNTFTDTLYNPLMISMAFDSLAPAYDLEETTGTTYTIDDVQSFDMTVRFSHFYKITSIISIFVSVIHGHTAVFNFSRCHF